jgi:hypothetical protein
VPAFPLAYDPKHPDQAMPAKWVEEKQRGFWWGSLIFTLVLAAPGIVVWRMGVGWLTGQSGVILWLLTLAPMLALPWWSDVLPDIVRRANKDWAGIVSDMLDDINRVTRFTASAPDEAALAQGERLVWQVEKGAYADTFGRMDFRLPQPAPTSPDAALAVLRAQAAEQVGRFSSPERAALFIRLRQQYDAFARNVQGAFTTAAENTLRDTGADAAAHRAAKDFLILASGGSYYEDQLDALERAAAVPPPSP